MLRKLVLTLATLMLSHGAHAQENQGYSLSGLMVDASSDSVLIGANVLVLFPDSTMITGAATDELGRFEIENLKPALYQVHFSYIGYKRRIVMVEIKTSDIHLDPVSLAPEAFELDQVVVEERAIRAVINGDTTEFYAESFKVNPDASAEDLVLKMPGMMTEQGEVIAQGETVEKVYVDGREFFGDDPMVALRNLPAEIIEKIQVYDELSDQAQFTGFNDGDTQKTINIVTRPGSRNGQFGKVYGGYGVDHKYLGGGNINIFNGNQRISVIGLSNNVNQQNFTTEDLLGTLGIQNQRRQGIGRGSQGTRGRGGIGGRQFSGRQLGSDPGNFLVGQQGGINTTSAFGLNYSDSWGAKLKLNGSYFFNTSDNTTSTELNRQYFLSDDQTQLYDESNDSRSDNFNHRVSLKLQYDIDESNSIIFTPKISFQQHSLASSLEGITTSPGDASPLNATNDYSLESGGYTSSNNLLLRHRFTKSGRTLSLNIGAGFNGKTGDAALLSAYDQFGAPDSSLILDQQIDNSLDGHSLSTNLVYTEPIGKKGQLQLSYGPSWSNNVSEQRAFNVDSITNHYSVLDPALSNSFDNTIFTQRGGISYRLGQGRSSQFMIGVNYQDLKLMGDQTFPLPGETINSYRSILPTAMFQFKFSDSNNLRFFYRTSTSSPSITQLQNVVDNTSPLFITAGNQELDQSYTHTLVARYGNTNIETGNVFFGFASATFTRDYISSSSFIAEADTLLPQGILLLQGAQFSSPVNLSGYRNVRSLFTYGIPLYLLGSNLNLSAGLSYSRTPGVINDEHNTSSTLNWNGGLVLSSNISERVDFTFTYALNYNDITNSILPDFDENYVLQSGSGKLNVMPSKSLVLSSNITFSNYSGLEEGDQQILLWNAGAGYKFLRGNVGEVTFLVSDILNQNSNIARFANEFYVEENVTEALGRYFMLRFTYSLRNFRI